VARGTAKQDARSESSFSDGSLLNIARQVAGGGAGDDASESGFQSGFRTAGGSESLLGVAQRAAANMEDQQSEAGLGSLLMVAQDAAQQIDNASGLSGLGTSVASGMDSLLVAARDAVDNMSAAGASDLSSRSSHPGGAGSDGGSSGGLRRRMQWDSAERLPGNKRRLDFEQMR
jgi:hypothetical protein